MLNRIFAFSVSRIGLLGVMLNLITFLVFSIHHILDCFLFFMFGYFCLLLFDFFCFLFLISAHLSVLLSIIIIIF